MDVSTLVGRTYRFEHQYAVSCVVAGIQFLADQKVIASSYVDRLGPFGLELGYNFVGSWEKASGGVMIKFVSVEILKRSRMNDMAQPHKEDCKQSLYFEFTGDESLRLVFNNDPVDADLESKALAFGERGSLYVDDKAKKEIEEAEAEQLRVAVGEVETRQKEEQEHWMAMTNLSPEQQQEMAKASRIRAKMLARGDNLDFSQALQSFMHHQKEHHVSPEVLKTCLATIAVYIRNITGKPWEPKFQRINCKNETFQKRVSSLHGALDILKSCGFVQIGDALVLDPKFLQSGKMALLDAKTKLEAIC